MHSLASTAAAIAAWLNATSICGEGVCWAMNSTDNAVREHPELGASLYYGSPGVAIFLSQLAEVEPVWSVLAAKALDSTAQSVPATLSSYVNNVGFYYGLAGVAFGLRNGASLPDAPRYRAAASELEERVLSVAPFSPAALALWNNTDIAHGAAGTGLYLLWAAATDERDPARRSRLHTAAIEAARWLIARSESAPGGGLRWARGPDTDGKHAGQYFPTFCCGTAGVAFFLAQLAQQSGVPMSDSLRASLLEHAIGGAEHVLRLGYAPLERTLLIPHQDEGAGLHYYYQGWCGGAPGWARLFVSLYRATAKAQFLAALESAVNGTLLLVPPQLAMLYPTPRGQPPWANGGQCCGVASAGTFLLEVAASDVPIDPHLKTAAKRVGVELARRLAASAVPAAPQGKGRAVPSAEEHAKPLETRWQAGWMQGAAGVGSFLLHAHAVDTGHAAGRRKPWPDEPW